ncbi:hypothetical protein Hrubri_2307 [Herbaspirillum rubrisubalbicans M1]|nr:hypothetical protein Hrubri_2307 [Herbaspirillum rubrisubalbicans M1]
MDNELHQFAKSEITRYLQARPHSMDTAEGIHQWWIMWPGQPESLEITVVALAQLETEGLLQSLKMGARVIWRLRRAE